MKIVFDTSMLLLPVERRIDVFAECLRLSDEECEFAVTKPVMDELESLAARRTKKGIAARVAKLLLSKYKAKTLSSGKRKADESILALGAPSKGEGQTVFATNDALLRRKLRAKGTKIICLKDKGRLDWC